VVERVVGHLRAASAGVGSSSFRLVEVLELRLVGGGCSSGGGSSLGGLHRCELLVGRQLAAFGDDQRLDCDGHSWKTSISTS